MRAYVDTSVLTAAYCPEPTSKRAQNALQGCEPCISSLTRLEFSSAVAKKLRARTITRPEAVRIIAEFQAHIRHGVFELLPLREAHYALASDWMDSFVTALRTLDVLHLSLAHAGDLLLITADRTLAKAGKQLGAKVSML